MFSFLAKKKPTTARINAVPVTVNPKETLLQAALRQGVDFPHSCRVGGCATCKCKLVQGKVKELTQTAYILSDEELDQGYILACQAVPQTDVTIEVDLSQQQAHRHGQHLPPRVHHPRGHRLSHRNTLALARASSCGSMSIAPYLISILSNW